MAEVNLEAPTSYSTAAVSGKEVRIKGTATTTGNVILERSVAPYDMGWTQVGALSVKGRKPFGFKIKEDLNTRYRATLTTTSRQPQVSNVVSVWRRPIDDNGGCGEDEEGWGCWAASFSMPDSAPISALEPLDGFSYSVWTRITVPKRYRPRYLRQFVKLGDFEAVLDRETQVLDAYFEFADTDLFDGRTPPSRYRFRFWACLNYNQARWPSEPLIFPPTTWAEGSCPKNIRLSVAFTKRWTKRFPVIPPSPTLK
jgi:hypothetical protein